MEQGGRRACTTTVVSSNCFSWQCHNNNAREENLFRVSRCEPHLAFCVCLCSIKVSRPTAPLPPPPPSCLPQHSCQAPKKLVLPFLHHQPGLSLLVAPHGKSVSLSGSFSVSLALHLYLSLFVSVSFFLLVPFFLFPYPSFLSTLPLLLSNLKPKSAKSFSCGFGSFQIPWPSLLSLPSSDSATCPCFPLSASTIIGIFYGFISSEGKAQARRGPKS